MRRARFLTSAQNDLLAILAYVVEASGSLSTGQRFVQRLRDHCHKLAELPGTYGRSRPELRADIRSVPYGDYVIFFRYADGRFEVVDILDGHRDIEAFFDSPRSPLS